MSNNMQSNMSKYAKMFGGSFSVIEVMFVIYIHLHFKFADAAAAAYARARRPSESSRASFAGATGPEPCSSEPGPRRDSS